MSDKQRTIRNAEEFARKGQLERAIQEYQRLVQLDPHDDFAWLKLGDLFVKKADPIQAALCYLNAAEHYVERSPEKALKVFQVVLSLDPSQFSCYLRVYTLLLAAGRQQEATEQLELGAQSAERLMRWEDAIQLRQKQCDVVAEPMPIRAKLAELYLRVNRKEDAVRELGKIARQLRQAQRNQDFLKVVERILAIKGDEKEHLLSAAQVYLSLGNPKEALSKLQALYLIDPRNIDVLDLLVDTFQRMGQSAKAVRVLKEMVRLQPEMKPAIFQRVREIDPQDADALAFTQQNNVLPPPTPEVAPSPSLSLVGLPSVSREMLKNAKEQPRDNREVRLAKKISEIELYVKFGLQEKAIDQLQEALGEFPDNPKLLQSLIDLYLGIGEVRAVVPYQLRLARQLSSEEAYELLRQVIQQDPNNVEALQLFQEVCANNPQVSEEIDIFDEDAEVVEEVANLVGMDSAPVYHAGSSASHSSYNSFGDDESTQFGSFEGHAFSSEGFVEKTEYMPELALGANEFVAEENTDSRNVQQSHLDAGLQEAEYFIQQGHLMEATQVVEELLRYYPQDRRVQEKCFMLGIQRSQPAVETLHAEYDELLDASPGLESPFALGLAYREQGLLQEAILEFRSQIGTGAGDATAYHLIGICYSDAGNYKEAIDSFKRALHAGPSSEEDELAVYYALGVTNELLQDRREALYYYQRLYQRSSEYRDIAIRLALLSEKNPSQRAKQPYSYDDDEQ